MITVWEENVSGCTEELTLTPWLIDSGKTRAKVLTMVTGEKMRAIAYVDEKFTSLLGDLAEYTFKGRPVTNHCKKGDIPTYANPILVVRKSDSEPVAILLPIRMEPKMVNVISQIGFGVGSFIQA